MECRKIPMNPDENSFLQKKGSGGNKIPVFSGVFPLYSQYGSFAHSSMIFLGGFPPRRWWCWDAADRSCSVSSSSVSASFSGTAFGVSCAGLWGWSPRGWNRWPPWCRPRSRRSFLRGPWGFCPCRGWLPVVCGSVFSSSITFRLINRGRNHK